MLYRLEHRCGTRLVCRSIRGSPGQNGRWHGTDRVVILKRGKLEKDGFTPYGGHPGLVPPALGVEIAQVSAADMQDLPRDPSVQDYAQEPAAPAYRRVSCCDATRSGRGWRCDATPGRRRAGRWQARSDVVTGSHRRRQGRPAERGRRQDRGCSTPESTGGIPLLRGYRSSRGERSQLHEGSRRRCERAWHALCRHDFRSRRRRSSNRRSAGRNRRAYLQGLGRERRQFRDIADGLQRAFAEGAHIVSMSLGIDFNKHFDGLRRYRLATGRSDVAGIGRLRLVRSTVSTACASSSPT
jgi:hypothetical protein